MTNPTAANAAAQNTTRRGRLKLAGALAALAATWLVALPWLATTKPIAEHIAEQKLSGIDPSAMFYTELEIAPAIAHRAERRRAAADLTFTPLVTTARASSAQRGTESK